MSSTEVRVPDLGDSKGVTVLEVLVTVGAEIRVDDPLITLETEKASMDVPSPVAGVIASIALKKGQEVTVGTLIATVTASAEAAPAAGKAAPAPAKAAPADKANSAPPPSTPAPAAQTAAPPAPAAPAPATPSPTAAAPAASQRGAAPEGARSSGARRRSGRLYGRLSRRRSRS